MKRKTKVLYGLGGISSLALSVSAGVSLSLKPSSPVGQPINVLRSASTSLVDGSPRLDEATMIDPKGEFSTEESSKFLQDKSISGNKALAEIAGAHNPNKVITSHSASIPNISNKGNYTFSDDQVEWRWMLCDSAGNIISTSYAYSTIDDHNTDNSWASATEAFKNTNVKLDYNKTYRIDLEVKNAWPAWDDHNAKTTRQSSMNNFSQVVLLPRFTVVPSNVLMSVLPKKTDDHDGETIQDNQYILNSLNWGGWNYEGSDESGYNNTRVKFWMNNQTISASYATGEGYTYVPKIADVELKEALSKILTITKASSQAKDFSRGGTYWLSKANAPQLHVGLNNDIFKAFEAQKFHNENRIKTMGLLSKETTLSNNIKDLLASAIDEYKITTEEKYNDVKAQLVNGNKSLYNSLVKPSYIDKYLGTGAPTIAGKNIIEWLNSNNGVSNRDGVRRPTNYAILSHFLQHQNNIYVNYKTNVEKNADGSVKAGTGLSHREKITSSQLIDYGLTLLNDSPTNFKPNIEFEGYDFEYADNAEGNKITTLTGVGISTFEDMGRYYIDWNKDTKVYSALYQPNSMNIANDMAFYPVDRQDIYFDKDLNELKTSDNSKTGEKAYTSIFYEYSEGGNVVRQPFVQDVASNWDIKTWVSTSATQGQAKQTLTGMLNAKHLTFDEANVVYNIPFQLLMTINPYSAKDSTGSYWINPKYKVLSVSDKVGTKTITLADHTSDRLSNSFNQAFGLDREGHPSTEGQLLQGEHDLSVKIGVEGTGAIPSGIPTNARYRLNIDTLAPAPKVDTTKEFGTEDLFFKTNDGYKPLYTSTKEVATLIEDDGIRETTLAWVDSEGNWYSKPLDISTIKKDGKYIQRVATTIDYQGLFKVMYKDIAGNTGEFYLWIQKPTQEGNNPLVAQVELSQADKAQLVAKSSQGTSQNLWVKAEASTHFTISNLINQNTEVEKFDEATQKWVVAQASDYVVTTKPQTLSSVGIDINSQQQAHSLMGDEVKLIVPNGISSSPSTDKFYQADVELKTEGQYRVKVATNIFTKTNNEWVAKEQLIIISKTDRYDLQVTESNKNEGWKEASYYGAGDLSSFDNDHRAHPLTEHEPHILAKGSQLSLINDFIKNATGADGKDTSTLKVEFSPLWYEWYEDKTPQCYKDNVLTFADEGRYNISYIDKLGNKHQYSFLVFNWPNRDFEKYGVRHTIDKDGKPVEVLDEFYESVAIASQMELEEYRVTGTMTLSQAPTSIYDNLTLTPIKVEYTKYVGYVWAEEEPKNLPSWLRVEDTKQTKSVSKTDDAGSVSTTTLHKYKLSGSGTSQGQLLYEDSSAEKALTTYEVTGTLQSGHIPLLAPTLRIEALHHAQADIKQAQATSFFSGDVLDLYEESGHRETMLVDNDNDPNTPKVHLYEDEDHFRAQLAEWLANGGTLESFWEHKADQTFGLPTGDNHRGLFSWDPKESSNLPKLDGNTKSSKGNGGALIGALIGGVAGTIGAGALVAFFVRKRRAMAYGKTPKAKNGSNKPSVRLLGKNTQPSAQNVSNEPKKAKESVKGVKPKQKENKLFKLFGSPKAQKGGEKK